MPLLPSSSAKTLNLPVLLGGKAVLVVLCEMDKKPHLETFFYILLIADSLWISTPHKNALDFGIWNPSKKFSSFLGRIITILTSDCKQKMTNYLWVKRLFHILNVGFDTWSLICGAEIRMKSFYRTMGRITIIGAKFIKATGKCYSWWSARHLRLCKATHTYAGTCTHTYTDSKKTQFSYKMKKFCYLMKCINWVI